jgi:hypothetical protein
MTAQLEYLVVQTVTWAIEAITARIRRSRIFRCGNHRVVVESLIKAS